MVIRPIELLFPLVNQRAPSDPAVMPFGKLMLGSVNTEAVPSGVIRPMELLPELAYQRAPSGPVVIPRGTLISPTKFCTAPDVEIRPMELPSSNQRAPSGPAVMPLGKLMLGSV